MDKGHGHEYESPLELSVIVPFLNEEDVLPQFVPVLRQVLTDMGRTYEVLFIDDGSTDSGAEWLKEYAATQWPNARVISLTRNFGHMQALTAGLDASVGEWVASLDADLQHPPALLAELLALAESTPAPVAQAVRVERRGDSLSKRLTAGVYYAGVRRFSTVQTPANVADFRVIHRTVVDQLRAMPERVRVYRLLLPWLGFETAYLEYEAADRAAGKAKYSFAKMFRLALSSVTAFSSAPLRIATSCGALIGLAGILGVIFVLINAVLGAPLTGWPSLMAAVLLLGGLQLLCIGVVGEYIAEILEQVRGRPVYVVANEQALHFSRTATNVSDGSVPVRPDRTSLPS